MFLGGAGLEWRFIKKSLSIDSYLDSDTYPDHVDQMFSISLTTEVDPNTTYYMQRLYGIFTPPVTGYYKFRVSSDDSSETKIAEVDFNAEFDESLMETICKRINGHTAFRDFYKYEEV